MKVFIVHAHPESQSFNGALTQYGKGILESNGHEVQISDLYAMKFDPVSDRRNFTTVKDTKYFKQQLEELYATEVNGFSGEITAELEKIQWCDVMVFQFPLWWFGLPAILKGWVDRVFVMGRVYGGGKWYDQGAFQGKRAFCSLTTGGGELLYQPNGINGDIDQILYPINHGILSFTGFTVLPSYISWAPARVSDEKRLKYLEDYADHLLSVQTVTPIDYPALAQYDDSFQLKKDG